VTVVGTAADLARLAQQLRVHTVLIPTPATPAALVREVVTACDLAGLKARTVPWIGDLIRGRVTVCPRDVDIQDLLARDPVELDGESIGRLVRDRVVLVTGAAGSIGSEICRQVLTFGPRRVVLLDHSENGLFFLERELRAAAGPGRVTPLLASICDAPRLRAAFATHRPEVVFHAAAHKHVPMMEENPGEAVKNNVFGTKNVVDEAVRSGAGTFVLISTDKAVNPTSVMGACKRLAEIYCHSLAGTSGTKIVSVRFGNVLGSNGSVVPIFREQILRGGPVTVTHPEMTRYFMTIPEAARLVLQAGALARRGEVFVLDMGRPIRVLDLARAMIRLSGLKVGSEVDIAFTGLRPGEKLHEELVGQGERRGPTNHPKVFVVRQQPTSPARLSAGLARLSRALDGAAEDVIDALTALVPGCRLSRTRRESAGYGAPSGAPASDDPSGPDRASADGVPLSTAPSATRP
jgi:FlaA1/EpsC-like NDP-sugar epimerase